MIDTVALRGKVLDLAIRGKLVPQDPNDEPASVLLERIRAQKQQMVKDGKLKPKDIKDDSIIFVGEDNLHYEKFADGTVKCIEDEIPFELPNGWAWVRFGTLTINRDSERKPVSSSSRKNVEKKYDYYGASGKIDRIDSYLFDEKLLLIGEDGANLVTRSKPIAFFAEGQYWVNNHAHCIDATDKRYLNYLCYFINAINLEPYVTGSAQPKMNQENMNSILISLPPFSEQLQILNQIDSFYDIIGSLENDQQGLLDVIGLTKSKILDLAIRGKLVPQNPEDEPASVLLERIRTEKEKLIKQGKIKRDKKESVIFKGEDNSYYVSADGIKQKIEDYMQYSLPKGWVWICLKDVATISSGKTPISELLSENGLIPYYKISDMNVEGNELFLDKTTNYLNDKYDGVVFSKGSFVFPKNGGAVLTNKKRILLHDSLVDLNTGVITFSPFIDAEYAFLMFLFIDFSKLYKGSTVPTVDANVISSLIFALPPLNEQQHIVQVVKKVFTQLDTIAESLS